ncbi:MAG: alpha amylase C-terminal domain-containing protein, partial [Anaerolineales bacterium]|nr:alpha amylase C-terminal domain-containing protein [Anaerolineales bacterium]
LAHPYGYPKITSSYYWTTDPNSQAGDSLGPPSSNDGGTTWGPGLGLVARPVYASGQSAGEVPANCAGNYPAAVGSSDLGQWVCEHRHPALAGMVAFRQATAGAALANWWDNGSNQIAFSRAGTGFVALNREGADLTHSFQTGLPAGVYCDIIHYDFQPESGRCVDRSSGTDAPTLSVDGSGQLNTTVPAMDAVAIHVGARMQVDYDHRAPLRYGFAWHTAGGPVLGNDWRIDDGISYAAWTPDSASVNVSVTGADGYVSGWVDWNQDGDFLDSGELVFANELVPAGQTRQIDFIPPIDPGTAMFQVRYRVYASAQTYARLGNAPQAEPQPTGDGGPGEVEGGQRNFNPTALGLAQFGARSAVPWFWLVGGLVGLGLVLRYKKVSKR